MTDSTDNARGPERIAHPCNGPDLPTEVFADPGRHGWYFREKMPDSYARFVRADLAPDPLRAVKVKPLAWEDPEFLGANPSYAPHTSRTTMGLYFANEHAFWYEGGPANSADNLEAAKSAAQQDYETRIRSALEPDPLADARVAALVEAVDYILDGMAIDGPDYKIDPEDDLFDAANSDWVRDTLTRLAAALAAFDKGGKIDG